MVSDATRGSVKAGSGDPRLNLSFAGCGFLGIYHVGVCSCFKEYAPHLIRHQISGASAGALVAAAAITDCCLGEATTYTLRIAAKARQRALGPLHPAFHVVKYLKEGLNAFLPDNAHEIANGRLNISLTRVSDRQNVVVNQYDSKEELIQALVCSSFIPFYCGIIPPKYRGVRYVDGGLSDNIPIMNDYTLTVSPFAGESDICPSDPSASDMHIHLVNTSIQCTMGNLYRASYAFFPPHPEVLTDTCKQGFDDALRFLRKNTIINISRHLAINSRIVTEEASSMMESMETESSDSYSDSDSDTDDYEKESQPSSQLPTPVVSALQAEVDLVNKGLLTPLYNMKMFKVVSLMTAPWLLPVDVTLVLAQRLFEWMPYMPRDVQKFIRDLLLASKEFIDFIHRGRHQYSARFSCQLAITEFDSCPAPGSAPSMVSVSSPFVQRRVTMEAKERHHHQRAAARAAQRNNDHHLSSLKRHRTAGFNGPVRCADDLRHELLDNRLQHNFKLKKVTVTGDPHFLDDTEDSGMEDEGQITKYERRSRHGSLSSSNEEIKPEEGNMEENDLPCDTTFDQFEYVLAEADKMDSILAFYYTEEDNPGVVKVTEIYALEENCAGIRSRSSSVSGRRRNSGSSRQALSGKKTNKEMLNSEMKKKEFAASLDSGLQNLQAHQKQQMLLVQQSVE